MANTKLQQDILKKAKDRIAGKNTQTASQTVQQSVIRKAQNIANNRVMVQPELDATRQRALDMVRDSIRRRQEDTNFRDNIGNRQMYSQRATTIGPSGGRKLQQGLYEETLKKLGGQIENEQNIVNNQGRAEDDPARIRAAEELEKLQAQQAETQAKLDTVKPAEKASLKSYTPEEEAYIRRIQQRLEKGQNRKQQIGYAYTPEMNSLIHLRNTPASTDEAGYVKWLQEGAQLGMYDQDTLNAMLQNTGTAKPYEQYKGLDDKYKSNWGDYKANAELQRIIGLQSAWNYGEGYDYTNERDALLQKRDYFTGEKNKAQEELDAAMAADTVEAREKANRYQMLAGEIPLPETWKEIRDENGAVIGTEEPTEEFLSIIRTGKKPADYDARESDYDAMMYDFIYGQGAWNREFINGTDEEADQAFDRVEELWDRFENGTVGELAEKVNIPEYQSKVGYYGDQLGEVEGRLNAYLKVDELMSQYEGIGGADYDPEQDRGRTTLWTYDDENYDPNVPYASPYTSDVHRIYSFINKGKEYQAYLDFVAGGNVDNAKVSEAYAKTALMNPEMKRKFNDLYTQGRYDEVSAFLEGLSPYLNAMYSDYEHIYTEEMARQMPVSSSAASLGAELLSGPVGVVRTAAGLMGDQSVADPYSEWYRTTRYNEQTQQAVADMIGGEGGKIYLQGMNTLRNMMNVAAVSLLGVPAAAQSAAGLAMFATQIYQDSTYKYLSEGKDYTKASAYALLDAALETAEEKLPYEAILSGGGNLFVSWLANSISEALEEFTGATVGEEIKAQLIGGGRSEWVQKRDRIYNEGGYTDENGQWVELVKTDTKAALAEAEKQALKEYGQQVIDNTLAGFVGGGLGAGYNVAQGYINTRKLGGQIRNRNNVIGGQTGPDQLIAAARGMNKDTQSYKMAEAIYNRMQKGKQASNYQLGKLAAAMDEESTGEVAQIARQTVENSVREELTQQGVDEVTAEEIAPAIVEAAIQGDASVIPKKAQTEIVKSVPAVNVLKSFLTPEGQAEIVENVAKATEKPMNIRQTVSALMKDGAAGATMSGVFARDVAQAAKRADIATQEELDKAKGTQHNNGLDAIVDDEIVQVTGMSNGKVDILKENGEHESVSVGEVQAGGEAMGTLLNFADVFRNVLDDGAFSTIVAQIENNKTLNGAKYVNEAVNTYIGYLTGNEVKTSALADKTVEAIKAVAQKATEQIRKERLEAGKAYTEAKPGQGALKFDGAEYGTQEFADKLKGMTRQQRNQAGALGELVKRLGVNVNLVNEDNNDVFGYEDNSGTLYINIGAKDQSGGRQNILTVAGHELTHWLEHTSETGYEELQKFVLDRMRKNGANIEALVLNTIDRYRTIVKQDLSVDKALSEIVANACDQVLANEEVAKALNEENPGLFKQVQGFVKNFLARVKAATNYDPESALNSSIESRILMKGGQETMDELARIYMGARQEAISRQAKATEPAEETGKSYSVRQDSEGRELTQEQREFFKDSKAVDEEGNLKVLYHGTISAGFTEFKSQEGKTGYFFTDSLRDAESYSGTEDKRTFAPGRNEEVITDSSNNYAVYLNLKNPLVIDAGGGTWNSVVNTEGKELHMFSELDEDQLQQIADNMGMTPEELEKKYAWADDVEVEAFDLDDMVALPWKTTNEWVEEAKSQGYDGVIFNDVYDPGDPDIWWTSDVYVAMEPNQIKSINNTEPTENPDIRFSVRQDEGEIVNDDGEMLAEVLPGGTVTAYSLRSWSLEDVDDLAKQLVDRGFTKDDADKWIGDINDIAHIIAENQAVLDYEAAPYSTMLKNNQEYVKTLDASTLCAKRLLYQGIYNEIQHMLPNTPLLPEDLIKLVNMMKKEGKITPCGICYVESRRRMLGKYAQEWLKDYGGEYKPTLQEVTTTDGLEQLRKDHPQAYEDFVDAMNAKGSANPKVVQLRTDYKGEIRKLTDSQIKKVKEIGGLRVQSFSDFEVPHLIDMMQAVLDMAAVDLTSQAYTKVPEFAWVFGDTGMKINLSLIGEGTGLNEKGELVFSSTEGMDFNKAMDIRKAYSKNVGTILVGMNDDHIIAAMGDDRIDFIIPFHKSGWSKNEMAQVIGMGAYKDYTRFQNEKKIAGKREKGKGYKTVPNKVSKIRNFEPVGPNGYWREDLNGTQNAELYLQKCAADQRMPKFANFLIDNGDMSYRLPTEEEAKNDKRAAAIRKGYWKLLIDFKMYDNEGNYSPQETVKPVFNMEWARKILDTYEGGANSLPTDHRIAQKFVDEYKAEHPRKQYNIRQDAAEINRWMMGLTDSSLNTTQERLLVKQYQSVLKNMDVTRGIRRKYEEELKKLQAKKNPNEYDRFRMNHLQQLIDDKDAKLDAAEKKLLAITTGEGYAALMFREHSTMDNLVSGRTAEEVKATIDAITKQIENAQDDMNRREQEIRKLAETEAVRQIQALMSGERLDNMAKWLRTSYDSHMNKEQLMAEMSQLRLRMAAGEDVTFDAGILAQKLVNEIHGEKDAVLEALRGMTLTLTPNQIHEIAGKDGKIREVQRMLAGTGIKVQEGERSRIDANWSELTAMVPSLDTEENQNPQNQAAAIVNLAQERQRRWRDYGIQKYQNQMENVTNDVLAAIAAVDLDVPTDPKAMAVLRRMNSLIKEMAGSLDMGAKKMADVRQQLVQMARTGQLASDLTNKMKKDMQQAIRYNNLITEQSEAFTWAQERNRLVRQLKSEQTQAVLDEQLKWKTRIAQDKANREKSAENMKLRRQIHTNIGRIRTMIVNETDKKNVPEEYKPVAREMLMMIIRNDLAGGKPITGFDDKILREAFDFLSGLNARDGRFSVDDLNTLNEDVREEVAIALADIQDGIRQYNTDTKGKKLAENLDTFGQALEKINNGVITISNVINHARSVSYMDREIALDAAAADVIRDMRGIKKEPVGRGAKTLNAVNRSVIYGNTTPVYFIKNLKNRGISELWQEFERAENKNGLELSKAKDFMDQVAEKYHYKDWDLKKKYTVTMNGYSVQMTVEQMMALYATWQREKMIGPEESFHLPVGGVILDNDENEDGKPRMERRTQKARKVTDGDIAKMLTMLTNDQKKYVHRVVGYLSREMSELGNEASMRMYGIKKYNEKWYFPFKVWNGVLSARSDKGITGTDENRAAHKSWSKRRKNNAGNALVIGNFTDTAVQHIVEMINYNTFAPAIENLNKVLNYQTVEQDVNGEEDRRNIRIMFREAYGREALRYMEDWMKDLQGGATQDQRKTMRDRLLSTFKKNAVAGSMSVALQQPMSYIRANMMINPKYMTQALAREYWKGTYQERLKHSGVSVIKDMGRFDMNFGQSARDWISPEQKQNAYEWISDKATILPELMDRWTWNRMWVAVKLEQAALHPNMDHSSDAFLDMVGERFNDVMRKTQVYDSTLVKSSNMRSQNLSMKIITSFMAEPTLSLNVLADAVINAKEKGGKQTLAKAAATFLLSATAQAAIKGLMGSGRTPDDKKTWYENFLAKFWQNMLSEANPVSLVPGYSDIIEALKNGELKDDAMGVLGKLKTVITTAQNMLDPEKSKGWYRSLEDTVGQVAQLFTNIPAKNLMRDVRAMYNWISGKNYADRPDSSAVKNLQFKEALMNADNLLGVINGYLGEAGYQTTNKAYYGRLYGAMKAGNQQGADEIKEYLQLAKGQTDEKIASGVREAAKKDDRLTPAQQDQWMIDNDLMDDDNIGTITTQYKEGKITEAEARNLYKAAKPELTDDDIFWKIDRINYQKETGAEEAPGGEYYRLGPALETNRSADIKAEIDKLLQHGKTKEGIKTQLGKELKTKYLEANNADKVKIRNELQTAYRALGYTATDADKTINGWKKVASKKSTAATSTSKDTTGRYGKGNIDLNNRKVVHNSDGSISTERSFSVNIDGKEVLLPTVINGKIVSEEEAIRHYEKTGEYLGKFNTVKEADEYAQKLHERQDWYYNK